MNYRIVEINNNMFLYFKSANSLGVNLMKSLSLVSGLNLRLLSQIIGIFFLSPLGSDIMDFTKGPGLSFG